MTQTTQSLIHVSEQAWGDLAPRAALVHLMLTATKLFSGSAALEKAAELRSLVVALRERGIPESAVALEGVHVGVSSGLFSKSSAVMYRVRVTIAADKIADVIDVITAAKQALLTHVEWDYPTAPDELVAECTLKAAARAKHVASTLGVAVARVHVVEVTPIEPQQAYPIMSGGGTMYAMRSRSSAAEELSGIEVAPTKKIGVQVKIAYALQ